MKKIKKLMSLLFVAALIVTLIPTGAFAKTAPKKVIAVQVDKSPMYKTMSDRSKKVSVLKAGTKVTVLKETQSWTYVQAFKTKGFVKKAIFIPKKKVVVTQADVSYIYKAPSVKTKKVATLKKGTRVMVLKMTKGWSFVRYGKVTGWLEGKAFTPAKPTPVKPQPPIVQPPVVAPEPPIVVTPPPTEPTPPSDPVPTPPIVTPPTEPVPTEPAPVETPKGDPAFVSMIEGVYASFVSDDSWKSESQALIDLLNQHRQANGKAPVQYDENLTKFAAFRWDDMLKNQYYSHNSPVYGTFEEMTSKAGLSEDYVLGENLTITFTGAQEAFDKLKDSYGHNQNMLGYYEQVGIVVKGEMAVMILGRKVN